MESGPAPTSATPLPRCPPSPVLRAKESFFELLRAKKRGFESQLDHEFVWLRELKERVVEQQLGQPLTSLPSTPTATRKRQRIVKEANQAKSPLLFSEASSSPSTQPRSPFLTKVVDGKDVIALRVRKHPLSQSQQHFRKRARELDMLLSSSSPFAASTCQQELILTEEGEPILVHLDSDTPGVTGECDVGTFILHHSLLLSPLMPPSRQARSWSNSERSRRRPAK